MGLKFNPITGQLDKVIANEELIRLNLSSGIISGGSISINADPTKIDISAGRGYVVDPWTDNENVQVYLVEWENITGVSATYLATSTYSYIGIDKDGSVVQFPAKPTNEERRDVILLGSLGHSDGTQVRNVNDWHTVIESPTEQLRDLISEFNLISSGNAISANGANLSINKSAGTLFGQGLNPDNKKDPNRVVIGASAPVTFQYRTQNGTATANTTLIDPTLYDNAGTATSVGGGSNSATNQRVFLLPNGNVRIQYGQVVYASLAAAVQAVQSESFSTYVNLAEQAILIGIISVVRTATALNDPNQCKILPVSKLGENIGGAAGISTSSLQQAYNNSINPEIVVNSTLGAVTIRDASTPIAAPLVEVQSNDGSSVYFEIDTTGITEGGGNAIFNANKIQSIDVANTSPSDGQVLTYSNANLRWEPATPSSGGGGSGDVVGPASSTNLEIPLYSGPTGKLLTNSSVTVTNRQIWAPNATYTSSMAIGLSNVISNTNAFVFGASSSVNTDSVTIGHNNIGTGIRSVLIGKSSTASGGANVCIGYGSTASGSTAITIGASANATTTGSIAIGYLANAITNTYAFAMGQNALASGQYSIAIGRETDATGSSSIAIGNTAQATANFAFSLFGTASHASSCVIGFASSTAANQLVLGGYAAGAGGFNSVYIGYGVTNTTVNALTINGTGRSGTNLAGVNMSIYPSRGTGNQAGGALRLGTSLAGASGTTLNSPTDLFEVGQFGTVTNPSYNNAGDFTILGILGYTMSFWDASTGSIYHYMDDIQHQDTFGQKMLVLQYNYRVYQAAASSAPADGDVFNNGICFYLDESGNNLKCKVKYSSGTVKTATIALA